MDNQPNSRPSFSIPSFLSGIGQGFLRVASGGGASSNSSLSIGHRADKTITDARSDLSMSETRSFSIGVQSNANPPTKDESTDEKVVKLFQGISDTLDGHGSKLGVIIENQERDSKRISVLEKTQSSQQKEIENLQQSMSECKHCIKEQDKDLSIISQLVTQNTKAILENTSELEKMKKQLEEQKPHENQNERTQLTVESKHEITSEEFPDSRSSFARDRWRSGPRNRRRTVFQSQHKATVERGSNSEESTSLTETKTFGQGKNDTASISLSFNYAHTKNIASQGCAPFVENSSSYLTGYLLGGLIGCASISLFAVKIGTFVISSFTKEEINTKRNIKSLNCGVTEIRIISISENPIEKHVLEDPKKDLIEKL